jgi:hypothetical protein
LRNWGISLALHGEHEGKNRRRSYTRPA